MGKSFIFCWNLFLVLWHNLQIKYIFIRSDQRLTKTQIIEINGKNNVIVNLFSRLFFLFG